MGIIYTDQELILNFTDTDDIDMSLEDLRVDYWSPTALKKTPTGTIDPSDIVTTSGSPIVVVTVAKGTMSIPGSTGSKWRFQIIDNVTGIAWTTMFVSVQNAGS